MRTHRPQMMRWLPIASWLVAVVSAVSAAEPAAPPTSVFAGPQADFVAQSVMREVLALAAADRLAEAVAQLAAAVDAKKIPVDVGRYNLACLHAVGKDADAALEALAAAVAAGFADADIVAKDPDLETLRELPRFRELARDVAANAEAARRKQADSAAIKPRPVKDGVAEVAEENTLWVRQLGRFVVAHEFPPADPKGEITTQPGPVGDLLRQWRKEGTAAGLRGVLYDNHDADHSNMDYAWFPELTRVEYSAAAKRVPGSLHNGLQLAFLHNAPVIGNASVAMTQGPFWRSMPRLALSNAAQAGRLADQYVNNMLYFYPEHRDHDPDHGDVYPANVPYVVISQGSSGSDRPFMNAVASTIAAFRPETQARLFERHLLVPTVQMILRRSRKPVKGRDEYLSGIAHPPVFDAGTLDVERMVRMAHDLMPDDIPPLVRLKVEEEYVGRPGIDYFDAGADEKLFDTDSAVARVARSARFRRRMVASVAATGAPAGRPVSFVWKLLHGDAERVRITPIDPLGTRAEIIVDWHPRAVYPGSSLPSARVDVAAFADTGTQLSAPAFLTWYFPPNERRTYEDVPPTAAADRKDEVNGDAPRRIVSIERLPATEAATYADPLVLTPADWTDTYRYDDRGTLLGWNRTRRDREKEEGDGEFTADGRLVIEADAGNAAATRAVRYVREPLPPDGRPVLREQPVPPEATADKKAPAS